MMKDSVSEEHFSDATLVSYVYSPLGPSGDELEAHQSRLMVT